MLVTLKGKALSEGLALRLLEAARAVMREVRVTCTKGVKMPEEDLRKGLSGVFLGGR